MFRTTARSVRIKARIRIRGNARTETEVSVKLRLKQGLESGLRLRLNGLQAGLRLTSELELKIKTMAKTKAIAIRTKDLTGAR